MKIAIVRGPAALWAKLKEWNLEDEIIRRERVVEARQADLLAAREKLEQSRVKLVIHITNG